MPLPPIETLDNIAFPQSITEFKQVYKEIFISSKAAKTAGKSIAVEIYLQKKTTKGFGLYNLYISDLKDSSILYKTDVYCIDYDIPYIGSNSIFRADLSHLFNTNEITSFSGELHINYALWNTLLPYFQVGCVLVPANSPNLFWRRIKTLTEENVC
jgi:hypothetical protein